MTKKRVPQRKESIESLDLLLAKFTATRPPFSVFKAIIEESKAKHNDLFTDDSWNPDYCIEISLKVKELRRFNDWVKSIELIKGFKNEDKEKT